MVISIMYPFFIMIRAKTQLCILFQLEYSLNILFWEQQKLEGIEINGTLSYRVKNTVQAEVLN